MKEILKKQYENFEKELEKLVNRFSMENGSDTPDYIIAHYLTDCLIAFNKNVKRREHWYGRCVSDDDKTARILFTNEEKSPEELSLEFCKTAASINAGTGTTKVTAEQLLEDSDLSYKVYKQVKEILNHRD
jgi:hypothetical protein